MRTYVLTVRDVHDVGSGATYCAEAREGVRTALEHHRARSRL